MLPESYEESALPNQSTLPYDQDDELTGYQASYNGGSGVTRALSLNARGELLEDDLPNTKYAPYAQGETYSANGTQVGNGNYQGQLDWPSVFAPPSTQTFDVRSGMAIYGNNPYLSQYDAYGSAAEYGAGAYGYSYDAAGRQTTTTQYPGWPNLASPSPAPAYTTSYDSENHVTTTGNVADVFPTANPQNTTATATYGPDGHQSLAVFTTSGSDKRAVHWDGDELLFATSNGSVSLYIGQLGTLDNSGNLIVVDRDQTGSGQTTHGNNNGSGGAWFSNWTMGTARPVTVYYKGQGIGEISFNLFQGSCGNANQPGCAQPIFPMTRPDGYAMVGGIVQGARTYDVNSGQ